MLSCVRICRRRSCLPSRRPASTRPGRAGRRRPCSCRPRSATTAVSRRPTALVRTPAECLFADPVRCVWDRTAICHEKFSFFKPKHHCLKCGIIVCDRCSPNRCGMAGGRQAAGRTPLNHDVPCPTTMACRRMTLPNIHKTQKQRVCNTCLNGIGNDTPAPAPVRRQDSQSTRPLALSVPLSDLVLPTATWSLF